MLDNVYVHDMVLVSYTLSRYPRAKTECLNYISNHRRAMLFSPQHRWKASNWSHDSDAI
jgi:hypothetical protein